MMETALDDEWRERSDWALGVGDDEWMREEPLRWRVARNATRKTASAVATQMATTAPVESAPTELEPLPVEVPVVGARYMHDEQMS